MIPLAPRPCKVRAASRVGSDHAKATAERRNREQQETAEIDPFVTDDLAKRAERQQRCNQRDLIHIDDPDRLRRADMKIR